MDPIEADDCRDNGADIYHVFDHQPEIVGHPVVTNPDPRLYRAAVKRRWRVRFFEPPEVDLGSMPTDDESHPSATHGDTGP